MGPGVLGSGTRGGLWNLKILCRAVPWGGGGGGGYEISKWVLCRAAYVGPPVPYNVSPVSGVQSLEFQPEFHQNRVEFDSGTPFGVVPQVRRHTTYPLFPGWKDWIFSQICLLVVLP